MVELPRMTTCGSYRARLILLRHVRTEVPAGESSGAIRAYVLAPDRKCPGQAREILVAVLVGAVVSGLARRARLGVPQRVRSLGTSENRRLGWRRWQKEGTERECERHIGIRGVRQISEGITAYSLTRAAVEEEGNGNRENTNAVLDSNILLSTRMHVFRFFAL